MWTREIVAGVDGSAAGLAAVRWAAREARRRHAVLRVVLAYEWDRAAARSIGEVRLRDARDGAAEADAARAATHALATEPGITVRRDVVIGSPVPSLLSAAQDAELVVVGNRGHRPVRGLLTRSVSQAVAVHAACPVVVVRGRPDADDGPVVVGVDGSTSSLEALGLGFDAAAARGADLVALLASAPTAGPWGDRLDGGPFGTSARMAEDAAALAEWLALWQEKHPEVAARPLPVLGGAATALVEQSRTARLVVVGSRGHGGLAATLIGAVGLHLLHRAECPVMINRHWPVSHP